MGGKKQSAFLLHMQFILCKKKPKHMDEEIHRIETQIFCPVGWQEGDFHPRPLDSALSPNEMLDSWSWNSTECSMYYSGSQSLQAATALPFIKAKSVTALGRGEGRCEGVLTFFPSPTFLRVQEILTF